MHNLYAIFAKFLDICKRVASNLVNESGNVPRRGVIPKFSNLEVVALNMASEAMGIDSESLLFANYRSIEIDYLILYPADNITTGVKSLRPCVINCIIEWQMRWMEVKTISALIQSQ